MQQLWIWLSIKDIWACSGICCAMKATVLQISVLLDLKILKATTWFDMSFASLPISWLFLLQYRYSLSKSASRKSKTLVFFSVFSAPYKTLVLLLIYVLIHVVFMWCLKTSNEMLVLKHCVCKSDTKYNILMKQFYNVNWKYVEIHRL